jgi:hypothetical protein
MTSKSRHFICRNTPCPPLQVARFTNDEAALQTELTRLYWSVGPRLLCVDMVGKIDLAQKAALYGVQTKRLNEQVKRNRDRFPSDFLFQLTAEEKTEVVANCNHLQNLKFSKALPFTFTEHGAIQASVLACSEVLRFQD